MNQVKGDVCLCVCGSKIEILRGLMGRRVIGMLYINRTANICGMFVPCTQNIHYIVNIHLWRFSVLVYLEGRRYAVMAQCVATGSSTDDVVREACVGEATSGDVETIDELLDLCLCLRMSSIRRVLMHDVPIYQSDIVDSRMPKGSNTVQDTRILKTSVAKPRHNSSHK